MKLITEKAPGKMMIAGEWSIMQPGNWCLVAAVDQYIHATISSHDTYLIHLEDMDIKVSGTMQQGIFSFSHSKDKLTFVQAALKISLCYVQEQGINIVPFLLMIRADKYLAAHIKYGLGSSAAVTVAVTKAVLSFYTVPHNSEIVFKLSTIAHLEAQQGKGSCFDIAASSYMATIAYRSFDRAWLAQQRIMNIPLQRLMFMKWPLLDITTCPIPEPWQLCIGWSGQSASTTDFIGAVSLWQHKHPEQWLLIAQHINAIVIELINAFINKDELAITALIAKNRSQLAQLSKQANINLETDNLKALIETAQTYGAAAKFSGAGGGDCGIALCPTITIANKVKAAWNKFGIKFLDLHPL
jgi:phosphomevalonate kinase